MLPNISILIITYNRPDDTLALLKNLKKQEELTSCVGEILLLNNASTTPYDEVVDFIHKNKDVRINYIDHHENLGVARGRNYLIEIAKHPFLLVLDDDVVFAETNAISIVSKLFTKSQYIKNNTAVITLDVFYYATKQRQLSAFPHKNDTEYVGKEWFLTYTFTGCAHLIKKEVFEKTGLYPEDFFYGMEEYDLSYRMIDNGYTLAYDNSVKVLHKESPQGRIFANDQLAMMWYNKCVVAWRYLPTKYFYSTAVMWSLQYLRKTKFDFLGAFKNWRKVVKIPKKVTTQKISKETLSYLRRVEARLWY